MPDKDKEPQVGIGRRDALKIGGAAVAAGLLWKGWGDLITENLNEEDKLHRQLLVKEKFLDDPQKSINQTASELIEDYRSGIKRLFGDEISKLNPEEKEFKTIPLPEYPSEWKIYSEEDKFLRRHAIPKGISFALENAADLPKWLGLSMTFSACSETKGAEQDFEGKYAKTFLPFDGKGAGYKGFTLIMPEVGKNGFVLYPASRTIEDTIAIWTYLGFSGNKLTQILDVENRSDINFLTGLMREKNLNCKNAIEMYMNGDVHGLIDAIVGKENIECEGQYPLWLMQLHAICEHSATGMITPEETRKLFDSIVLPKMEDMHSIEGDLQVNYHYYLPDRQDGTKMVLVGKPRI